MSSCQDTGGASTITQLMIECAVVAVSNVSLLRMGTHSNLVPPTGGALRSACTSGFTCCLGAAITLNDAWLVRIDGSLLSVVLCFSWSACDWWVRHSLARAVAATGRFVVDFVADTEHLEAPTPAQPTQRVDPCLVRLLRRAVDLVGGCLHSKACRRVGTQTEGTA